MNAPKKNLNVAKNATAVQTARPKLLKKLSPASVIKFVINKDAKLEDYEIRVTFEGSNIVTRLLQKGVPISEQVILVKTKPTPPPIPTMEIIRNRI